MLRKYVAFSGLCLGFFIVMMDTTAVPLIYTTLMNEFYVSPTRVVWVNNVYLIAYAAFLLLGGRLGDSTDRKLIVLIALVAIGLGAVISGTGQTFTSVVSGRALMGIGAGLLTPQSMAYISILFIKDRGAALGVWAAVAGIGTASGPMVTQMFLTIADWRWVMWINVPIAFICFLITVWNLPSDPGRGIKFWETLVSSVYGICLAGVIIGVHLISTLGIATQIGGIFLVISVTTATLLIRHELRKKCGYILSPELWLDGSFLRICLISGLLGLGLTGFYLPLAFLLEVRMNFGPVAISMVMITISLSNALIGPFAGRISDRIPPEIIVRHGLILFGIANILVGLVGIFMSGGILTLIALCIVMVIAGAGTGLSFAPLANLALGRASVTAVGRAAAFFNSARQVFSALGVVIVAIVFDLIVRLQLRYDDLNITVEMLRESSNTTAIASFACFLLIAFSLSIAAYISRLDRQKSVLIKVET